MYNLQVFGAFVSHRLENKLEQLIQLQQLESQDKDSLILSFIQTNFPHHHSYKLSQQLFITTSLQVKLLFLTFIFSYQLGVNNNNQMNEQLAKKRYSEIIKSLYKSYRTTSDEVLQGDFKNLVLKAFKIQLTADSLLEQTLKDFYKECQENYIGTEGFCQKLEFVEKLNNLFYRISFTSKREHLKMREILLRQKKKPTNEWIKNKAYLQGADNVTEFRYEFLTRYCGIDDNTVIDLIENQSPSSIKQIKIYYQEFFAEAMRSEADRKILGFIEDIFSAWEIKSQMLSPKLIKDLQKFLGVNIGSNNDQIGINKILVQIAQQNDYSNDKEIQQRLEDEIKVIENILRRFSGLNIFKQKGITLHLGRFGSLISGFAGLDADLDLTILTNSYINEAELLKVLSQFFKKELKTNELRGARRVTVELVLGAKIPLITVVVAQRGKVELKIDIIINNILGVVNSKFLSVYAGVRWVKNLGILIKIWGKKQQVITKQNLSSYAVILMLIHFLIKSKKVKSIMDNRVVADKPYFDYKRTKQGEVQQFKVYYSFKTDSKQVSIQQRVNYYKILMEFFKYYSTEFWLEENHNRIITVDQSTDKDIDQQCALTIKDPFDKPHNPGRMKANERDFLRQKLADAYSVLQNKRIDRIKDMFTM